MTPRYRIIKEDAGQGGFGRIHQAWDETLERNVAIKTLDPIFKIEPSESDIQRFHREAKNLASLSHPHIPAIYDIIFERENNLFQIIFQWIDGIPLSKYIQDHGVLTVDQCKRWFYNICSALEHSHSKSIIHRDIKPSNIILVNESDDCILVDFGISINPSDVNKLTGTSGIGSPGYMSPEQERGDSLTPASDVYTLGIILYECLAGIKPTVGEYRALNSLNETISPNIDNLIQSCLRENTEHRPKTPTEFIKILNKATEPHSTFTLTLVNGSLYEIQTALDNMSPIAYSQLPIGQRLGINTRLKDLIRVNEDKMQNVVVSLLTVLVGISYLSRKQEFEYIVENALNYGFEFVYSNGYIGEGHLREKLYQVAPNLELEFHTIMCIKLFDFLRTINMAEKSKRHLHDLRELLQNLLYNPNSDPTNAEKIADIIEELNKISHPTSN